MSNVNSVDSIREGIYADKPLIHRITNKLVEKAKIYRDLRGILCAVYIEYME